MLPELLERIAPDEEIATVTADGASDTRACHDALAARGAAAIIPPRRNARPWKPDTAAARARNEILRTSTRPNDLAALKRVSSPKTRRK